MAEPIAGAVLLEAANGHFERTALDEGADVPRCLHDLGVDALELGTLAQQIADQREVRPRDFSQAFLDGFVIGVRAARLAEGIEP